MKKVVVITGASSGLGLSHAIFLISKGFTVFGTSRRSQTLDKEKLKEDFVSDHTKWKFTNKEKTKVKPVRNLVPKKIEKNLDELIGKIRFFNMDVTSDESVNKTIKEMEAEAKKINGRGIDVVINNAGISFFRSIEILSMDEWKTTFDTNLFGMVRVAKAILPNMRERREGQIINTSTLGALAVIPFQTHYSASKIAVKAFSEGLRVEVKKFNIKVSTILPSDINTAFNTNMHAISTAMDPTTKSIDLEKMINQSPTTQDSPYFKLLKPVWKVIVNNLIIAPPPLKISKKILRIIKTRKPRVNYHAGDPIQRFLIFLIRRVVTDELVDWLLPLYFGLK
ncbi:MAG: SDR family oxidoreductase [Asgard group archaeon]|nr:SDR family oxidoreductase [Asgard group archaeon]